MAAPFVAGAVSLVRSFRPELSVAQVKHIVLSQGDTLDTLSGMTLSGKRLDIFRALQYLLIKQIDYLHAYRDDNKQEEMMN